MAFYSKLPLSVQLVFIFTFCASISLIIIEFLTLGYVLGVAFGIKFNIENAIIGISEHNLKSIISDNSLLLDREFKRAPENFLNIYSTATEDSFRIDYPFEYVSSYFGWPNYLSEPVIFSSEYNNYMSFSHSSYNVNNKSPLDFSSFSSELVELINKTATNDNIIINSYDNNKIFQSGYFAMENYMLFREYPGATSSDTQSLLDYDPFVESWYTDASNDYKVIKYSSLYFDEYVNQYMISMSRSLHNIYSDNFIGVSGCDMIISDIIKIINNIKYSNDSRTILIENSGIIIADGNNTDPQEIYTYENITNPKFTESLWQSIIDVETNFIHYDSYYIQSNILATANGQYILITIIPQYIIKNTLDPIINGIYYNLIAYSIVAVIVFIIVFVVSIISIGLLTHNIVKPLLNLVNESKKMTQNIGTNNILDGVNPSNNNSTISETRDLQQKFRDLILQMQNNKTVEYDCNPYYKQNILGNISVSIIPNFSPNSILDSIPDSIPDLILVPSAPNI